MSGDYKKRILSLLVDWYENSPAYVRGQTPSRRRMMRLYDNGQTDFNAYNIENPAIRKDINQAVLDLADGGLVEYEWARGQRDHILSRLWLNFERIERVYAYLVRQPKGDAVDDLLSQLRGLRNNAKEEWAARWLEDTIAAITRKRSAGSSLPENVSERDDLLKAIACLADRTEIETFERVFSTRCFGDSKRFERSVKARLIRILKKYLIQDECGDEEALRSVGIVRYPEQFEFSGPLSIALPKGEIDFSLLPFGGVLTIEDVNQGKIALGADTRRILSIENRANYVEYIHKHKENDELVLFHGGQYSPAKGVFLQAIVSALPEGREFRHWGDIDYGGFSMLARLRREILPEVRAWKMAKEDLSRYAKYTVGFSDSYGQRLTSLLELPELHDCIPCIEHMLKLRVRLEQEAMLT
ncbi:MAG: DUF2220 domain-containing protein [Peptococcaceae bacterium]|jgi:hypothetical protein|nr:DUF2220 domain-containing protein [Peptococcaceae bacterium]